MNRDISKDSVRAVKHRPTYDSEALNRAMETAISDENFLNKSINLLRGLKFPALKGDIINHVKKSTNDPDMVSLFQNLDGYIQFKDQYHIRKAIVENDPKKKTANQITDETRENPVHTQSARRTGGSSIKASQAVNISEERRDFPEVNPSARTEFVCQNCGKSFHAPDDLAIHKRFEEGVQQERKISQKSRIERQRTVHMHSEETRSAAVSKKEAAENQALDTNSAVAMENLLEGLDFPAEKEEIIGHIKKNPRSNKRQSRENILSLLQRNLKNNIEYNSAYEIERATKLVVKRS
ncbi:DUF2795 domain-containing protein [Nitrososphaera sp. AFS]|uniref:DUF2795 domain-containing protein n=1 Tax=Nitrososphaera sp. AFS TaxID=2301191 RepID=UPI001392383A|nr:DUF2795 domain-containing protein [Nitrososphaera sp. AFS]NAL78327.1 hypothetical protein [Nitrososphaera sp. AFS]